MNFSKYAITAMSCHWVTHGYEYGATSLVHKDVQTQGKLRTDPNDEVATISDTAIATVNRSRKLTATKKLIDDESQVGHDMRSNLYEKNNQIISQGPHEVRGRELQSLGDWKQMGPDIDGEAACDNSGWSVSLSADGTTVAIGAYGNDGNGEYSGHVRVYRYNATNSNGQFDQLGGDIDGEARYDSSGLSVSLSADGTTVAIGAYGNDGNGEVSGHVRVYEWQLQSNMPSALPTLEPSNVPSGLPTLQPSKVPSVGPTLSARPSLQPSALPSALPTLEPSNAPSGRPSLEPSSQPSTKSSKTKAPTVTKASKTNSPNMAKASKTKAPNVAKASEMNLFP